jgi:hypothetical protein
MSNLRSSLIRLAHAQPELRADLIPLLKAAGDTGNLDTWVKTYEEQLLKAVREHPEEYAYGEDKVPSVAAKMAVAFEKGTFNHDGRAIKATCRALGIKHTRTAIKAYISGSDKTAGCEKLPEGGMRDNCEKKVEEGKDKPEKKATGTVIVNKVVKIHVQLTKTNEIIDPESFESPEDEDTGTRYFEVIGNMFLDFGGPSTNEKIRFTAQVNYFGGSTADFSVAGFETMKSVTGSGADPLLGILRNALEEALYKSGRSLLLS